MEVSRRSVGLGFVAALAAHNAGASVRSQTGKLGQPALDQIDRAVREYIANGWGPGASVTVMQAGKVLLSKGFGLANIETGTPVTAQTVFRAGSVTKQFTAAAIMLLAQDGGLAVDDPLAKYVPELSKAGPVTLRMLLNQTSGIHTYTDEAFQSQVRLPHTPQQMVDYIASQKLLSEFKPGTAWKYSNSNFYLLGVIVERASGMELGHFFAERVFPKAGLKSAALDHEADVVPHRAAGYLPISGHPRQFRQADFISMDPPGGAGALRATTLDLALWHQALFAGRVVATKSLAEMITPGRLASDAPAVREVSPATQLPQGYGFGLEIGSLEGEPTIGHGGGIPGFATYLVTLPRLNVTTAVMVNGEPSGHEPLLAVAKAVRGNFA